MGFERRLFARTDVEVQGELFWQSKRIIGGIKNNTVPMQTIDMSVNGAKVLVHKSVDLPLGASLRIVFHGESSPARVREVLFNEEDRSTKMLRLELEVPPEAFMIIIEQWLDAGNSGRKFVEESWFQDDVEDDSWFDPDLRAPVNPDEKAA